MIQVYPAPDRRVRIPEENGRVMGPEGSLVPEESYWLRRLRDGDVTSEPPRPPKATRERS